jgi:hypothetical protein
VKGIEKGGMYRHFIYISVSNRYRSGYDHPVPHP